MVWETANRVCDFINAHEDLIHLTTFGEYRDVMRRVMKVIKEAHNVEKKRRQTSRKRKREEVSIKTQSRGSDFQSQKRTIEKGGD